MTRNKTIVFVGVAPSFSLEDARGITQRIDKGTTIYLASQQPNPVPSAGPIRVYASPCPNQDNVFAAPSGGKTLQMLAFLCQTIVTNDSHGNSLVQLTISSTKTRLSEFTTTHQRKRVTLEGSRAKLFTRTRRAWRSICHLAVFDKGTKKDEGGDPYAIGATTKASVQWVECVRGLWGDGAGGKACTDGIIKLAPSSVEWALVTTLRIIRGVRVTVSRWEGITRILGDRNATSYLPNADCLALGAFNYKEHMPLSCPVIFRAFNSHVTVNSLAGNKRRPAEQFQAVEDKVQFEPSAARYDVGNVSDTPCAVSNVGPPKSVTTYDRRRDDYDRGSEVLPIVSNAGSRTGHLCTTGVSCVWHDMSAPSRPRVNWLALCRIRDERTCSRRGAAPFSESSPPVFTGSKSQTTGRNRRRPSRNLRQSDTC
ncbi:uncharacterized protein LACBIDRAFT_334760 [Laccaria bicolor S238N-H82]|uniref:Predicted protein n=1 Tax=Laccaria bicolor (strain S238N-H82 / ATCC MYA-4686) TaxID=486041 RepID=B0E077_LACBS|nr:uncharacterized protein LACBIDRAFT_334760 [Laccaria bicolor S238N-H82]EDQ99775.1 predicted protein [Laccaria bicolor S238N-H82]|eukprot:XP_001889611.1 predicted protein [Laccaria bicolor S238N-H82]